MDLLPRGAGADELPQLDRKPDGSAEGLFERIVRAGLFQHWGAAYGDIRPELDHLLRLLGVEEVRLD